MIEKRFIIIGEENLEFIMQDKLLLPIYDDKERLSLKTCCDLLNELNDENEQLKQFIQELTTKGTGQIHLSNGSIYKVDTILINIKGDD